MASIPYEARYFCYMELLMKFYREKSSRIAVKFLYEHAAKQAYESLLDQLGEEHCTLKLELLKNRVCLTLINVGTGRKVEYKSLEYKSEQLRNLQKYSSEFRQLIFVHVYSKSNTLLVAKPFHKEKFIVITDYEILNLENK